MEEKKNRDQLVKDAENMTKKTKIIMAALKAAEADLEAFQVNFKAIELSSIFIPKSYPLIPSAGRISPKCISVLRSHSEEGIGQLILTTIKYFVFPSLFLRRRRCRNANIHQHPEFIR